ncbi:MAG: homoserine O-acetyltransferase [Bacteroidales bacterium]|nr:homoserine O-acetyltransferase [Bacteroidales bacterium]
MLQYLNIKGDFTLESGALLSGVQIAYHTYGELNGAKDNVVWICHALTASSDVADWWSGLVGPGKCFNPEHHFIVCANVLGSCYGTTGPLSEKEDGEAWYQDFPDVTVRDMVRAHIVLREHLGIENIEVVTGGSIGSFQALEWSIMEPDRIKNLIIVASGAKSTAWNIGLNEAQRMAIRGDKSFYERHPEGGKEGMKAARAVALLSYRNALAYNQTQPHYSEDRVDDLKAVSYQQYQGEKLAGRFNAYSYYSLTRSFDSHHVGRGRGGLEKALAKIQARTLIIAIDTDILFPEPDQWLMKENIPDAKLQWIHSDFGHDGFLLEYEALTEAMNGFLQIGKAIKD